MQILSQGDQHRYVATDHVLINYYSHCPAAETLRAREAWLEQALAAHEMFALLVIIDRDAQGGLPDAEFRQVSKKQAARYAHLMRSSTVVIEGEGLTFTLLRSLLRGLTLTTKVSFPIRYYQSVEQAMPFVLTSSGSSHTEESLGALIQRLRRA